MALKIDGANKNTSSQPHGSIFQTNDSFVNSSSNGSEWGKKIIYFVHEGNFPFSLRPPQPLPFCDPSKWMVGWMCEYLMRKLKATI